MQFIYQTPTPNLSDSVAFFKKAGWEQVDHENQLIFRDKNQIVRINSGVHVRPGLVVFASDEEKRPGIFQKVGEDWIASCPSNIWVYWEKETREIPIGDQNSILGNPAGLTIETLNMTESLKFYTQLGFTVSGGDASHGFVSMQHESGFGLTLLQAGMCPHLFLNPSISYFNGKEGNPKVIEKIRQEGLTILQEVDHFNEQKIVDNLILREPGGMGFFIFND